YKDQRPKADDGQGPEHITQLHGLPSFRRRHIDDHKANTGCLIVCTHTAERNTAPAGPRLKPSAGGSVPGPVPLGPHTHPRHGGTAGDHSAGETRSRARPGDASAVTEGAFTPSAVVCQSSSASGSGTSGGRGMSKYSASPSM